MYVRNEVGLELVEIDVERAIEPEGRGDRGDDLRDQTVEVDETRLGDVELVLADIEDGLVVDLVVTRGGNGRKE